jgi:hypothetical protein
VLRGSTRHDLVEFPFAAILLYGSSWNLPESQPLLREIPKACTSQELAAKVIAG